MGFTPNAEPKPEQQVLQMTAQQLQEALVAMAKEMKKPTEEEQRAIDEERMYRERRKAEMIQIAQEEEAQHARTQASCEHKKPNGQYAVGGQIYSNGHQIMRCLRCQKVLYDAAPAAASMANGLGGVTESFV